MGEDEVEGLGEVEDEGHEVIGVVVGGEEVIILGGEVVEEEGTPPHPPQYKTWTAPSPTSRTWRASTPPPPALSWRGSNTCQTYSNCSPIIPLTTSATAFIKKDTKLVIRDELFQQWFFLLDFETLSGDAGLLGKWPSLGEELEDRVERVCGVFGLAMHHVVVKVVASYETTGTQHKCDTDSIQTVDSLPWMLNEVSLPSGTRI